MQKGWQVRGFRCPDPDPLPVLEYTPKTSRFCPGIYSNYHQNHSQVFQRQNLYIRPFIIQLVSANQLQTPKSRRPKRSTYEIIYSILNILQEPHKKTHVMYNANLSYDLTVNYLNKLQELGLVSATDGLFTITDKGRQVLDLLNQYVQTKKSLDQVSAKLSEIFPKTKRPRSSNKNQN